MMGHLNIYEIWKKKVFFNDKKWVQVNLLPLVNKKRITLMEILGESFFLV